MINGWLSGRYNSLLMNTSFREGVSALFFSYPNPHPPIPQGVIILYRQFIYIRLLKDYQCKQLVEFLIFSFAVLVYSITLSFLMMCLEQNTKARISLLFLFEINNLKCAIYSRYLSVFLFISYCFISWICFSILINNMVQRNDLKKIIFLI